MLDSTRQAPEGPKSGSAADADPITDRAFSSQSKTSFDLNGDAEARHMKSDASSENMFWRSWDVPQEEESSFPRSRLLSRLSHNRKAQAVLSLACGLSMLALVGLAGYGVFCLAVASREDSFIPSQPEVSAAALRESETSRSSASQLLSSYLPLSSSQIESFSSSQSQGGTAESPLIQPPVVTGPKLPLVVEKRPREDALFSSSEEENSGPLTTAEIVKKLRPSVVGILAYKQNQTEAVSQGSGLLLSEDGYIVTNAHVVSGADGINVVLSNQEQYEGVLVGADPKTDLAVVKIDAHNLYPAALGDSTQLEVGESVVAVGNPGSPDLAGSVTQGIVSAVERTMRTKRSSGYAIPCIQTDADINLGNSGGPLVDRYGRVVGINSTEITADSEEAGFAIPVAEALPIVQDLVRYGRVTGRVWLGIGAVALNEVQARLNDLPTGLLISVIYAESNLSQAGVRTGDVLQKIDGQTVEDFNQLRQVLDRKSPGDKAVLTLYRSAGAGEAGRTLEITVYLVEDTDSQLKAAG